MWECLYLRVAEAQEVKETVLEKDVEATDAQQCPQLNGIYVGNIVSQGVVGLVAPLQVLDAGQDKQGEQLSGQDGQYEGEEHLVDEMKVNGLLVGELRKPPHCLV